jgi:serine/threonine protein kinase
VLINDHGDALLTDFGLARIRDDMTSRTAHTSTPEEDPVGGSLYWLSPERLEGGRPRESADIYALGITILEVCPQTVLLWIAQCFVLIVEYVPDFHR